MHGFPKNHQPPGQISMRAFRSAGRCLGCTHHEMVARQGALSRLRFVLGRLSVTRCLGCAHSIHLIHRVLNNVLCDTWFEDSGILETYIVPSASREQHTIKSFKQERNKTKKPETRNLI